MKRACQPLLVYWLASYAASLPVSVAALASEPTPETMPQFVGGTHQDYYPAGSRHRREEGVVDLEFSIDAQGRAYAVKEVFAASRGLAKSAAAQLRDGVFKVPPDWMETGADKLRFVVEYQFNLAKSGIRCPIPEVAPRIAGAKVIAVCGSPV